MYMYIMGAIVNNVEDESFNPRVPDTTIQRLGIERFHCNNNYNV